MLRFADVSYFQHKTYKSLSALVQGIGLSLVYLDHLKKDAEVLVVQHGVPDQSQEENGITYSAFHGNAHFFRNPVGAHKRLQKFKPDMVLVQGLIFPVQVWLLRRALGPKAVILVQHHGEQPFINKVKRFFGRLADRHIDGYLFTSKGNAEKWVQAGIISDIGKCHEVLECSTQLSPVDKSEAKRRLGFHGSFNFLWVGRLNTGKDPLTVLEGFEHFLSQQPDAKLHMIYQTEELLEQVTAKLASNSALNDAVKLVGKIPHSELATWYSAADFFISGSHHEGSGYAVIEAMACGCIPVVTRIPSFHTITGGGKYAFSFEPGNTVSLTQTLSLLQTVDRQDISQKLRQHFESDLSFKKIAQDILNIANELRRRK